MTHRELARRLAERENIAISSARSILDAATSEIRAALDGGEAVTLARVGTLMPPRAPGGRTRFRATSARGKGFPAEATPTGACAAPGAR